MCFQRTTLLCLTVAAMFSIAAQSSDATCSDPNFDLVNATGQVSFGGLQPRGSVPGFWNDTWTIHTGIKDIMVPADNSSFVLQKWWMSTDPIITTSAADFPFAGCVWLLIDLNPISRKGDTENAATDGNNCHSIFNDECQAAIIDIIEGNITASSNPFDQNICEDIDFDLSPPPSECKDHPWLAVRSSQAFGNPNYTSYGCMNNSTNIFNGSRQTGAIMETGSFNVPIGNYSYYDEYVNAVSPLIISMWPKNSTTAWGPDTKILCMETNNIEAGSRVPVSGSPSYRASWIISTLCTILLSMFVLL